MRKPFTTIAILVVRYVAHSTSKQVSSYLIVLATFSISAIFHVVAFGCLSICSARAQFSFYLSTGIALLAEDVAINISRFLFAKALMIDWRVLSNDTRVGSSSASPSDKAAIAKTTRPPLRFRLLGYTWVCLFTICSQTRFLFQDFRCTWAN